MSKSFLRIFEMHFHSLFSLLHRMPSDLPLLLPLFFTFPWAVYFSFLFLFFFANTFLVFSFNLLFHLPFYVFALFLLLFLHGKFHDILFFALNAKETRNEVSQKTRTRFNVVRKAGWQASEQVGGRGQLIPAHSQYIKNYIGCYANKFTCTCTPTTV